MMCRPTRPVPRVVEGVRDRAEDREAQGGPQPDGRVGLDDGVEDHGPVSVGPGGIQDVLGEGPAGAASGPVGVDHEAGVGDAGGGAAVVGGEVGGGDDGTGVVLGDVDASAGARPQARASSSEVSGSQA